MENKKKAKVDYAAIIREFEMYGRGRSLKQFCDDSSYVYPNVLRYYRKCFWNSKSRWQLLLMVTSLLFPWRLSRQQVSTQLLQVWTLASQKNRPCLWLLLLSRHTVSSRCTYRSAMGWSCHFARQV